MTVPPQSVAELSRSEKQELLRKVLLERANRTRTAPASFAQERLWFLDRLQPDSAFYNIPSALRLAGALDVPALERALGEVVRRHEALRTTFQEKDGTPVQVIAPFRGFALPVEELSAPAGEARDARLRTRTADEAARPFDLSEGPLFRATLLRLAEDEHVLLLCIHHIVADEWSMGVLFGEMGQLYGAFRDGGDSPLPELPAQYADYVAWQRQALQGEPLERQLAWWTQRLAGAPALLELPTDHPRPAVQTFRGASERVVLPAGLLDTLNELRRSEGATLFMVLLAAYQVLLARYSGTDDIVVGSPITGRTRREVEGLIGFFLNTLALRTELGGDPTFREVVRRVRDATLGAYQHQDIPFERLVEALRPERSLSYSPLFQVMFVLHEADRAGGGGGSLPGLEMQGMGTATTTAKFDLTLALSASPGGLTGSLEYSTDLYDGATVQRMLTHFERLLRQVAGNADLRLSQLELVGDDERRLVLEAWNRTDAPVPAESLHARFEAQADRTPDAAAVTHGAESLTYRELDARANRLAHHLVALGVTVDARVGLCLERGAGMMTAVLGILKAGAAYVPLDPAYPADRLSYMLADSAATVLVTQASLADALPAGEAVPVRLDADAAEIAGRSAERPRIAVEAQNLAYVIYTSGSTGRPKGVALPHGPLVNLIAWSERDWRAPGATVTLQFASISFDVSCHEMFSCWNEGGRLVLIDEEQRYDLTGLLELMEHERVERLFMPAVALQQLAEVADARGLVPSRLREVQTAGEALRITEPLRRWMDALGVPLHNHYGPSETHVVTALALGGAPSAWPLLPSIGGPIANTQCYVLDGGRNPVPVGVPGELFLAGASLARGYLNRPALTAEKFVPDPFTGAGARMYRTGDRVRWLATGEIEFLGRVDEQVKIRGFRIEPGEVEAVLAAHPRVREAVVVAREDVPGDRRLVAYVVGDASAGAAELRAHLKGRLPDYMVPSAFVTLDALPMTPSGKVARRALPAPEYAGAEALHVAPRTPSEEVVAGIFADVLRVERVGSTDDFFVLGGHSLLATRLVSRVRAAFGVELPLRALFEAPVVADLALRIEALRRAEQQMLPPVVPVERTAAMPLSFAQERLWFLDQLQPGSAFYNMPVFMRLEGLLHRDALERALGEIVRRHESLRTTFAQADGAPVQAIAPFSGFALAGEDLSGFSAPEREAEVRRRAADEAGRPFDLAAGPLFRAALLRLAPEEHALLVTMHHIVSDAWSLGVLARELSALYGAFVEGRPSPLPELPVQYADYAAWQRRVLQGAALEGEIGWWKARLAGAPALLELPTDHPRPALQTFRGAFEPVRLSAALLQQLQALGRAEGATLYMVLLAAFQSLLARYAGTTDVVVGSPIAGRARGETEGLIGFFLNTLALRTDLSGEPSFREALRRVREMTLGAYEHQDVPFERLVEELQPERSLSHAPVFQVMFILQEGDRQGGGGLQGLKVRGLGAESGTAKFDLTLALTADSAGLSGAVEYSTDLFEPETIRRMVAHLGRLLGQVAAAPDARLSDARLLDPDERSLLLEEWNDTDAAYPADATLHALFEAQAARTPDARAVTHGGDHLTYAELNARANRLAHHLVRLGVGAEVRVGIGMERGLGMLVSLLAVLKAGGAYVPLDPSYPADRLAFTLADSGVAVLLTQEAVRGVLPVSGGVQVVSIDGAAAAEIAGEDAGNPVARVAPRGLAYLIYTSGSTGVPKGVAIEHESAVVLLSWAAGVYTAEELSGVLAVTSISFDLSVFELFLPLSRGGRIILVENALALANAPAKDDVRLINTVPSAIAALLKHDAIPSGVTTVNLAGEPLRAELADALYAAGIQRVYDLYGPSEDTTYSTFTLRRAGGPETIGRPIANTRAYVLDARLRPVPAGVVGELYLGGRGLARGYLGRPGLTAERFVPDLFGPHATGRLYRTGDKARWRADGTLEYLGRLDAQVKVRGYRIELGEIEAVLRVHGAVDDCVVVAREDVPGDRRLVAYVVGRADADALRGHLRRSVPEYMVPAAFVLLDALPLTPNGKTDRKALPAPEYAGDEASYVAPRTPTEDTLAEIWAEVLRAERVGVRDNFFEAGGHSLLAIRVVSRVREALGVELPLRALFEAPNVAELAERVDALRREGARVLPPVVPVDRTGPLPLSFAQERLWFLDRLDPANPSYNVPWALRLGGGLDAPALERALGEVVLRHEALRTVFRETDGAPAQVVMPFAGFVLPVEELSAADAADRAAEVRRRVAEEAARPFDLSAGPLFRATLLRLGEAEHVLVLCVHHIVSDAWSFGVLQRELSALYAAFREGAPSPLAALPVQYADYAAWQRRVLGGEALDAHLAWWKERLAGAPGLLELPTDYPRPPVQGSRGAAEPVRLPAALLAGVHALARTEGATPFMLLLAAFQVLLARDSGSDDVVVGTPIAGRARREVEDVIGFFLNTLALRTDLSGDPSFRDVLRQVREMTLGAYEHQEIPFERLVEELQPDRSLSHAPLFQAMFVLHDAAGPAGGGLPGLELGGVATETTTSKFDLTLALAPYPGGIGGSLEYSTDLFQPATIVRMLARFERLLAQVVATPGTRLSQLDLVGEDERRLVLEAWNRTAAPYPAEPLHALFEAQADRTPDAVAVTHGGERITYRALDERANRIARHLLALGVPADGRVGLCLERGAGMMAAVLGILKAGAACVPLDPAYPAERLSYMLADCAATVLVTQASLADALPAGDAVVVRLDADAEQIAGRSAERPRVAVDPGNLAYVIYTSGSTGLPKGVAMQHAPLVNLLAWNARDWRRPGPAVTLQFATISFDASFHEMFSCWMEGGRLVLIDEEQRYDPAGLLEVMEREGVERLFMPAVALQQMAEVADSNGLVPSRLREVQTAGEALRITEPLRRWMDALGAPLYNHYGPSETHVVTSLALEGDPHGWPLLPTIGGPVANTQCYVVDGAGTPVPIGVPGELFLGGDSLARGYLNRPALTAERFVPDPFGAPGGRMYRTGDRARWLAAGAIDFLGRVDEQVKIRGFRIEPGEVEAVLAAHPRVREAVVVAREDAPGDRRLVAYVTADAGVDAGVDAAELRAHLKGRLPEYMVPGAFVVLDALPLTPSGKVARRALPAPEYGAAEDRYVAPRTPVEAVLAEIWAAVLRVERVGSTDDFFALGGHSLLAIRVVSRVRDAFAVELPLRALFEAPTMADLAVRVEALRSAGAPLLPPVVPVQRTGPLPLSFAQERLWFLDRLQPDSAFYNIPAALRLGGALDRDALEHALGGIVRRHESLRTVFVEAEGGVRQVVTEPAGFPLPVDDLSGLEGSELEAAVRRRAGEEAARPFDLAAGPLFRAHLLRVSDDEHVLLLTMHHIVSDAWSLDVLFRDLWALYGAGRDGREAMLPALPVQYADYAAWQRRVLGGEALDGQIGWWKEQLEGAPALLELPADHPRPAVQTFRGAYAPVQFSRALLERLQALGRAEGATMFMVLLSAFQVLLSKYSGSTDVVVGSPIAGRSRRETEELIGFFLNTLALRTDLSGNPGFRETLRRVRDVTLGAYEHQEVPFERLVEALQPERSLSHSPLFQVLFVLQNADAGTGGGLGGLELRGVSTESGTSKFDLTLALTTHPGGIAGTLEYSSDLFERGTAERMLAHLGRLLEQVAADPDVALADVALVGADERRLLLEAWNDTAAPVPAGRCIHELVEDQAERTPHAPAVEAGDASLTYGELNARANRLAHHLARRGVGPEVRVAIALERGAEMVVALLAVLKAGGAYVPLDPGYPPERLAYMLADAGAAVLLAGDGHGLPVPAGVPVVDPGAPALAAEPAHNPRSGVTDANVAYVIYTSGSSGRPKGVMNAHAGVVNRLWWMQAEFGLGADDAVLQKTPFSFDVSVWEFFWPLQQGARLVMARPGGHGDPRYLQEVIETRGITTLHFVPSMLQPFVEAADPARCGTLKRVVCSGEALPPALVEQFHARFPATVGLHNLYGPTEAAVDVSHWACARADASGVVPIGRPAWNTRLYVLDTALNPVPAGVGGELYIGGVQVARGYLGRPALTAGRFVPDPFAGVDGARLYRTGDRARWRTDGALEYLGRLDEQVKIRGFRIETGEIEAVLRQQPDVRDCVVVAREDEPGDRRLVAYVVGEAGADALRAALRGTLPEFMVPAAFVPMEALPLTPNGKLDRRALPAPAYVRAEDRYVAPRTEVEAAVARVWGTVLRVERAGVHDNFFELGGHSLLAVRVVSGIRDALAVELPLRAVFEAPTVAELAERVETLQAEGLQLLPPVVPVERTGELPLSFAQERLWFLDRLAPGSALYNIPTALRLNGALDVGALERALGEIVRRHEALRTVFREGRGGPAQVVLPLGAGALPVENLSELDEEAREARLRLRVGEEAQRPFDLETGPLFRGVLLRLAPREHVLMLCVHHIASDGWSLGVLFRELSVLYQAYRDGNESPLPELPVQYADHAVWQRRQLQGEVLDRQVAWWKERLAGAPELLELNTDHPRPAVQAYRGAYEPIRVGAELLERLEALGRAEGATLFMVLTGAFQVLLSKYSGSEDLVVGTTIAGRTRGELEGLIGLFMNTLVLRTDLSGQPSFREVLRRVREMTLGAYEHQEVPFERLVEELRPERSLGHSPLIQVLIELHAADGQGGGGGLPGLETRGFGAEVETAKFDLSVAMTVTPRGLTGGLTYNTDLFERATVRALVDHLVRVLEQVSADPDQRISRLRLMSRTERDRVVGWNRTTARYPAERCIHQWFEAQAARTPDAPAILFGEARMTFGELDAQANRIARHLAGMGVGLETRVGLCLERGLDMMPAILGVMKAGAAYVPVDPSHPAERMSYVLEDSGVRVLLTQAGVRGRVPAVAGVPVVCLDGDRARIEAESADALETGVTSENLCYVIYTSGSTGRPKGVAMHHRGVSNYLHWGIRAYGADGGAGAPVFSSMAVDLTITNLLPLFAGRPVRMLPEENAVEALADMIRQKPGFGLIKITPTHLALLTPLITPEEARGAARTLVIGADFLNAEPTVFWQEHAPGVRLMNEYGPTETVVGCSAYVLPTGRHREGPVPVGHPIQNLTFYVLDARMEPVPVGLPGELYIGGVGVARGYLGRPALTAEKFVPDPFVEAGARMYRTGDRARWRADGNLMILGRTDNQVKIRGYRVELGEVEAALRRREGVTACLAVMREDVPGDRRLVAYVVGDASAADPPALREHMLARVPEYMVPSAFVRLDALPQTATGKLNPRMLPPPVYATTAHAVAPRSDLERQVADVWTSVLSLPEVGVHDNFFDLGGTSLLLYRVHGRLREIRPGLRLVDLFRYTTVESLAAHMAAEAPQTDEFLSESRARAAERRAARRPVRGG